MARYLSLFLCLLLSACERPAPQITGYIEGDYRYINSPEAGILQHDLPAVGSQIAAGEHIGSLDDRRQQLAQKAAQADFAASDAAWQNLQTGARASELAQLRAQIERYQSQYQQAQQDHARAQNLFAKNALPARDLERAASAQKSARAALDGAKAQLKTAQLPARSAQIAVASANRERAQAALARAQEDVRRRQIYSAHSATVSQVYAYKGEWVGAGRVLMQLLPAAQKVVFFVPESQIQQYQIGQKVRVLGDGIAPVMARIDLIHDKVEFTPPVIYSEQSRAKLVYRLQARLAEGHVALGLPVTVQKVAK